jgi:hypothetical protein
MWRRRSAPSAGSATANTYANTTSEPHPHAKPLALTQSEPNT